MSLQELEFKVRRLSDQPQVIAIDLIGGVFPSNMGRFSEIVEIQQARGIRNLVLNCEKLDFVCSNCIGYIVQKNDEFKKSGKKLLVSALNPEIKAIIDQFSLQTILNITENESEAMDLIFKEETP